MEFLRRRPTATAIRWVERSLGRGHRVLAWRRMTGGISSAVHRLTVARGDDRRSVVLRQYATAESGWARTLVEREVATLEAVATAGLPAPRLLSACPAGDDSDYPAVLMTRCPGRVFLTPSDPDRWLGQIAATAAEIHACSIAAPPFESWLGRRELEPPESSSRPELWRAAFAAAGGGKGVSTDAVFIHRDFQHFNFLWSRERLSGVVDWTMASRGPPGIDVGHCRLNLAVLFSAEWAEEFRLAYEAEAGQAVDPYWDLHALLSYSDRWQHFIPIQVDGRAPVDTAGMTARVEAAVAGALARLGA